MASPRRLPSGSTGPSVAFEERTAPWLEGGSGSDWPWLVAAVAGQASVEERDRFHGLIRAAGLDRGRVVVATCHRVELYGIGDRPEGGAAVSLPWRGLVVRLGPDAAWHALRLAVGLESVVLGEEQVLGQVRDAHRAARRGAALDPRLDRLFQIALRVGRVARAGGRPTSDGLARRAVRVLADRLGTGGGRLEGRRILVVGAGAMGRLLARGVLRAGAAELVVASRDPARAAAVLAESGAAGEAFDLDGAARCWRDGAVDGVLVALAGPWSGLGVELGSDRGVEAGGSRAVVVDPVPIVDLSAPSALPEPLRRWLGDRFVGIDDLAAGPANPATSAGGPAAERAFRERAEALVSEGLAEYRSWLVSRSVATAIRSLQAEAELIRRTELEVLFRRLPDLGPRERDLIGLHSRRIVARLLHRPIRRLRTGEGIEAARRLFEP